MNQALDDRVRCVVGRRKTVAKQLVWTLGERLLGTSGPCTSVYRLAVGTTSGPESCFTSRCHSQAPASSSQSWGHSYWTPNAEHGNENQKGVSSQVFQEKTGRPLGRLHLIEATLNWAKRRWTTYWRGEWYHPIHLFPCFINRTFCSSAVNWDSQMDIRSQIKCLRSVGKS